LAFQQSGAQKAFGLLGYAWQVAVNLLYLAIIAFVLNRTSQLDPKLTIVIATLGLLYVTIRGIAMSQAFAFAPALLGIAKSLDELKGRSGKRQATSEDYAIAEGQLKRGRIKFYIQSLFLSLTSLMCIYAIYTALAT
jgi:branched-subunit amino acid ABC-type transport system permease component